MARAPLGLPRARRLSRAADYGAVRRSALKTRDAFFLVQAARSDAGPRIGMAVSRRVSSKAVVRNRIKRQIRESFRLNQSILDPLVVVVIAQPPAAAADTAALARSLQTHWQRLVSGCNNS